MSSADRCTMLARLPTPHTVEGSSDDSGRGAASAGPEDDETCSGPGKNSDLKLSQSLHQFIFLTM